MTSGAELFVSGMDGEAEAVSYSLTLCALSDTNVHSSKNVSQSSFLFMFLSPFENYVSYLKP